MNSFSRNNIFLISLGTGLSKLIGFSRQILIAAAFGIGITYDAYNYAYIIPGFILIIIAGINGPIHNAIVAVLTPLNRSQGSIILSRVSTKLTLLFLIIGTLVFIKANFFINILGPDLSSETRAIAVNQLKILSLCIPFSAFIGLSFGALNSKNKFFISSFSPSIISISTIIFITFNFLINYEDRLGSNFFSINLLALATLNGTIIQFAIQAIEINKADLLKFNLQIFTFVREEIRIFKLIIPASLSSGIGQINVFIDMFFVSSIQGAASALAYGNFLIQAPLGIASNILILPILPKFSNLINEKSYKDFIKSLIKNIEFCFLATFFLAGIFISFNNQLVGMIFQRGAFNEEASVLVERILLAYAIGIPFYLLRDLMVRTYYILERTKFPFQLSLIGIICNIVFDWILIGGPRLNSSNLFSHNFGVMGIVLSSGLVNLIISSFLILRLKINGKGLPMIYLIRQIIFVFLGTVISSYISRYLINNSFNQPLGSIKSIFSIVLCFFIYCSIFFIITKLLKVNKLNMRKLISSN